MSSAKSQEPKGTSGGPETTVGKKSKRGATQRVSLKLAAEKKAGEHMFALVADGNTFDIINRLEVHGANNQVIKLNGPFTSITAIKDCGTKKDKVSLTLGNAGAGLTVCAEKPE